MTWTIRVLKWAEYQHYGRKNPAWTKLYRRLLDKREWRTLHGSAAKLLVDIWMLAAEAETGDKSGEIRLPLADVAWRLRVSTTELVADLELLVAHQLVEVSSEALALLYSPSTPEERGGEAEQRQSSVPSEPAGADGKQPEGKAANPMAVLGPLIREHLYIHDGQPPSGYDPRRCADICVKLVRAGRYTTDDLRDAILVIPRLRAGNAAAGDSLRKWFAKQGKLTMRALTDRWGSGSVLEQLLHIVRKASQREPSSVGAILNQAMERAP